MAIFRNVTLQNVSLGQTVWRGRDWRRGRWKDDEQGPGTVIGFVDGGEVLRGSNSPESSVSNVFWTVNIEDRSAESLTRPWKHGGRRAKEGDVVTVGAGWAAVTWSETGKSSIYPIGAGGPLGEWWTGEAGIGYGRPCYSLSREKATFS